MKNPSLSLMEKLNNEPNYILAIIAFKQNVYLRNMSPFLIATHCLSSYFLISKLNNSESWVKRTVINSILTKLILVSFAN